jgi:hypothetical protein
MFVVDDELSVRESLELRAIERDPPCIERRQ